MAQAGMLTAGTVALINPVKLEQARKTAMLLESELEETRRNYKWWKALFADKDKQQTILDDLHRKGEALKKKLAEIPVYLTLRQMEKKDAQTLTADMVLLMVWLGEQLNVDGMTEAQMLDASVLIVQKYGKLRLEDIALCFRNAVTGKYGKVYNRIDLMIICEWLDKYTAELDAGRQYESELNHINSKIK